MNTWFYQQKEYKKNIKRIHDHKQLSKYQKQNRIKKQIMIYYLSIS